MTTNLSPDLARLGDALEQAAAADLRPARRRLRPSRRLAVVLAALAVGLPAAAYGAARLVDNGDVAASLPAGAMILVGTEPTCTTVTDGVEYRCTLAKPPAPEVQDFKGTVEPTVDAKTKLVNGGCRSLQSDGLVWECYLGQEAVKQQIIGPAMLGVSSPTPGVG